MHWKRIIKQAIARTAPLVTAASTLSLEDARANLNAVSPCPSGTCVANNIAKLEYDLQIIIPAYNVEKYIAECLDSVLAQDTDYRCLATVVNDGSTDRTGEILSAYVEKFGEGCELEVVAQHNKGLSGARNAALSTLRGEYILLLDSDDVLPTDTIQHMLEAAKQTDADILQGSWYDFGTAGTTQHLLSIDGVLSDTRGVFSGYPWGKLYKHTVLEHFRFPEGFWFEDTPVSFMLAAMPYRFAATKQVVYGYRFNPNGITATSGTRPKAIDSYWITERCLEEFPAFGLVYDQRAYEYLLRQSLMNWRRTKKQPREVRESVFVLTAGLIDRYFASLYTRDENLQQLEDALRKRQFKRFELIVFGM